MTEPTTEAGRAALQMLCHFEACAGMKGPNPCDCGVSEHILAIEAEARAEGSTHSGHRDGERKQYAKGRADALREAAERVPKRIWLGHVSHRVKQFAFNDYVDCCAKDGEQWPCDVERIRAILDPEAAP